MESFNGRFRDECLNENWFSDLADAREKIAHWKQDYNERRPHSSLQYRTPVEFAAQSAVSPRSTGPQDPQNPIQDGTSILPWTTPPVSTRSRFRDQRVENFPLGIGQVSIMDGHSGHRLGLTTLRKSAVMTPLSEVANLLINFGPGQSIPVTVNSSRD